MVNIDKLKKKFSESVVKKKEKDSKQELKNKQNKQKSKVFFNKIVKDKLFIDNLDKLVEHINVEFKKLKKRDSCYYKVENWDWVGRLRINFYLKDYKYEEEGGELMAYMEVNDYNYDWIEVHGYGKEKTELTFKSSLKNQIQKAQEAFLEVVTDTMLKEI